METIQLSIDESLLAEVQQATSALQMTPSDFIKVGQNVNNAFFDRSFTP